MTVKHSRQRLKILIFLSLKQKKESLFLMTHLVAGTGLEPVTFGL